MVLPLRGGGRVGRRQPFLEARIPLRSPGFVFSAARCSTPQTPVKALPSPHATPPHRTLRPARLPLSRHAGAEGALGAPPEASRVTRPFTGRPARGVANLLSETIRSSGVPPLPWPWQSVAAQDVDQAAPAADDAECFPLLAGQVGALCRPDQEARDVVQDLVEQAAAVLDRLARLR
jgi:hypothetical protein